MRLQLAFAAIVLLSATPVAEAKIPPNAGAASMADCTSKQLRVNVSPLQGATGSRVGELLFHNTSAHWCRIEGPVRLVLRDGSGRALPLRRVKAFQGIPVRSTISLAPGRTARAMLVLSNACDTASGSRLWVILALNEAAIELGISAEGRCDRPEIPPMYGVNGFEPAITA